MRPVRPQDAAAIDAFIRNLSPQSRQRRFHGGVGQLPPDLLYRFTHPDPDHELALLAIATQAGREVCVGEARYAVTEESPCEREFALAVADHWQGLGIGSRLLRNLTDHAQRNGVERLYGDVLHDNLPMITPAESLGYSVGRHPVEPRLLRVAKALDDSSEWGLALRPCRPATVGLAAVEA
jgi:GNAT superfamily N-acetyltransferase